jgi:hypothetical protein
MTPLVPYRLQIGSWIASAAAMCWLYDRKDDAWFLIGAAGCAAAALLTGIAARRLASAAMPSFPDDPAEREALRREVCRWSAVCALLSLASIPLVRLPPGSPRFVVPLFFALVFGHLAVGGAWLVFSLRRRRGSTRGPK